MDQIRADGIDPWSVLVFSGDLLLVPGAACAMATIMRLVAKILLACVATRFPQMLLNHRIL